MTHSTPTPGSNILGSSFFVLLASFGLFSSAAFAQPSKSERLTIQGQIDKHAFLDQAIFPWGHNSYNSEAYDYAVPNQSQSMTTMLDAGLRLLDIDLVWAGFEVRMCHGGVGTCAGGEPKLETGLREIKNWFDADPERKENDVVLVFLESKFYDYFFPLSDMSDVTGCHYHIAVDAIRDSGIDDLVYKPSSTCSEFTSLAARVTKADVLAAGKNVILLGADGENCDFQCMDLLGETDKWGHWVFNEVPSDHLVFHQLPWFNSVFRGYPDCDGGRFPGHSAFSAAYNDIVGTHFNTMTTSEMENLVGCGINAVSHEMFEKDDPYHEGHIWSWDVGQPNASKSWYDCARFHSSDLNDYSCTSHHRYACKHMTTGAWAWTAGYGPWTEGAQACYEAFGLDYELGVPVNGYQKNLLHDANVSNHRLWVNFNDRDDEGDWEPMEQFTEVTFDLDGTVDGKFHRSTTVRMSRLGATPTEGYTGVANTAYELNRHESDKIIGDWDLHFDKNLTLSLWFKFDTSAYLTTINSWTRLVEVSPNGRLNGNAIVLSEDGGLRAWCDDEGSSRLRYGDLYTGDLPNPPNYLDGEWHHVAYVVDADDQESRLYVDGTQVMSVAGTCPDIQDTKKISIGGQYTYTTDGFDGTIDNVRVHGIALSAQDIEEAARRVPVDWHNHNQYSENAVNGSTYGRYVTVTLPRTDILSLAEVQVFDDNNDNVALGKTATQSSNYTNPAGTHVASKAVDGNTSGEFSHNSVTHTLYESHPWWRVDLGQNHQISRIEIYNRTDGYGYRLNDAKVHVGATVNWYNHNQYRRTALAQRSYGRYVRISIPRNEILSLAEVEVYDTNGNNVALNMPATQSSDYTNSNGTHVASKAVDGNNSGTFSHNSVTHTKQVGPPWWEVDLGQNHEISEIRIYNRTDGYGYRLNDAVVTVIED